MIDLNRTCIALYVAASACLVPALPGLGQTAPAVGTCPAHPPAGVMIDDRKLEVAKQLTDSVQRLLQQEKAIVAVVGRKGGDDAKRHDRTGMAHTGIAVYDPRAQGWIVYNLQCDSSTGIPRANLWRTALLDFFYGQTGYEKRAMILVPDDMTQQRIYKSILSGKYKSLLFKTQYNLLTPYDGDESLNCNKWVLMNLAAARIDDYDPQHVLAAIHDGFEPAKLHFNFIEREVIRNKKSVRMYELPSLGNVKTVTPQSLCDSPVFKERFLVSPDSQSAGH